MTLFVFGYDKSQKVDFKKINRVFKICKKRWPKSIVSIYSNVQVENLPFYFARNKYDINLLSFSSLADFFEKFLEKIVSNGNYDRIVFLRNDEEKIEIDLLSNVNIPVYRDILEGYGGLKLVNFAFHNDDYKHWDTHIFNFYSKNLFFKEAGRFEYFPYFAYHRWNGHGDINDLCFRVEDYDALRVENRDKKLVVILGNSASFDPFCDYQHSLAGRLSDLLNKKNNEYIVANFSMPSATVIDELNIYNIMVARLKPDIVISHSFYTDINNGLRQDSRLLKTYGIFYSEWCEKTAKRVCRSDYDLCNFNYDSEYLDKIIEYALEHHLRLKKTVETDGALFILGLQPIALSKKKLTQEEIRLTLKSMNRPSIKDIHQLIILSLFNHLSSVLKLYFDNFLDFHSFFYGAKNITYFADDVHVLPAANTLMSREYSKAILNKKLNSSNSVTLLEKSSFFQKIENTIENYSGIVIYGAGFIGLQIHNLIKNLSKKSVFIDDSKSGAEIDGTMIIGSNNISDENFIYIISVFDDKLARNIKRKLIKKGVRESSIFRYYEIFLQR